MYCSHCWRHVDPYNVVCLRSQVVYETKFRVQCLQIVLFFASSESSKEKIPTILHLAAKFGLKELLAKLIDLPGSAFANSIANSDRQQPADMASKNNHKDVQEMLELFAENVSRHNVAPYRSNCHDIGLLPTAGQCTCIDVTHVCFVVHTFLCWRG